MVCGPCGTSCGTSWPSMGVRAPLLSQVDSALGGLTALRVVTPESAALNSGVSSVVVDPPRSGRPSPDPRTGEPRVAWYRKSAGGGTCGLPRSSSCEAGPVGRQCEMRDRDPDPLTEDLESRSVSAHMDIAGDDRRGVGHIGVAQDTGAGAVHCRVR